MAATSTKKTNMEKQADYHKLVAQEIIDMLEKGTAPWQKPWASMESMLPHNGVSKRRYHGMNALRLMYIGSDRGYEDPRWMTFKQIQELGGHVKKGEKGTVVTYWKFTTKEKDENGNEVEKQLDHPVPFRATVFNAMQCEGLPELKKTIQKWTPLERAETILKALQVEIIHDQADRNYYSPMEDRIHLTPKASFDNQEAYYSTALHEAGHSTGHSSRLNRDIMNQFGTEDYAREELRAEIASFMLCTELGIANATANDQHAAYVGSWIKALKEDPNEIFRAAKDADAICEFLYEREKNYLKELGQKKTININDKEIPVALFDSISTLEPMVYIEWSEFNHPKLEKGNIMTFHEASSLFQKLDQKIFEANNDIDSDRYYKTKFYVLIRNDKGELCPFKGTGVDRYDLGDLEGGLLAEHHFGNDFFKIHYGLSELNACISSTSKELLSKEEEQTIFNNLIKEIESSRTKLNNGEKLDSFLGLSAEQLVTIGQDANYSKFLHSLTKEKTTTSKAKRKTKLIMVNTNNNDLENEITR